MDVLVMPYIVRDIFVRDIFVPLHHNRASYIGYTMATCGISNVTEVLQT